MEPSNDSTAPSRGSRGPECTFGPLTAWDVDGCGETIGHTPFRDRATEATARYSSVSAVNKLQTGLLATYATNWLGPQDIRSLTFEHREQVRTGDVLTLQGSVSSVLANDVGLQVKVELRCLRQSGAAATVGSATFLLNSIDSPT